MPLKSSSDGRLDCLVTLPNSVVYHVSLPENATGLDCVEKICSILGIVEIDYFGLRFIDHHGIYLWLNLRMKLSTQIKYSSPYQLHFRVKYFIDPKTLQQPATRHLFYLQIKALMAKGQLPVSNNKAPKIGALIAQSELGDIEDLNQTLCYPQYFKEWTPGVARAIAKEHSNLIGLTSREAEIKLLDEAFQLENWGVCYVRVVNTEDNSPAYLGIGGFHIRLCNDQWRMVKKISYECLLEASFRNKNFTIMYRSFNSNGEQEDKRLLLRCPHHRISRYLFRLLTEDHTFFTHETVSERVLDHLRQRPWQQFCQKYLGQRFNYVYHFDIVRTQHEAYSRAWEVLHQVNQEDLNASLSLSVRDGVQSSHRERREVDHQSMNRGLINIDSAPSIDLSLTSNLSRDLNRLGLSKSSCDIAKQLLENPEKDIQAENCPETDINQDILEDKALSRTRAASVCLTKEGTEKFGQFIQKIVDSKLCRVCMDSPVSAVFCPCGHLVSCYKCALECLKCPLCRQDTAYVQYVYGTGL